MTGWKRYAVAVVGGLIASVLWGVLMTVLGTTGYAVYGAMAIMICALV